MSDFVQILHFIGLAMSVAGLVMRIFDWRAADSHSGK